MTHKYVYALLFFYGFSSLLTAGRDVNCAVIVVQLSCVARRCDVYKINSQLYFLIFFVVVDTRITPICQILPLVATS